MKLFSFSNKPIHYIYHLSDINIHCDKRHDEYQNIFSKFLNKLNHDYNDNHDNQVVIITGNLLNTKNRITSPEIILAREFIYNLSKKCPVIIIPGNNDKDENIKAVISKGDMPLENIHYINKSGCYTLNNINFVYLTDHNIPEYDKNQYTIGLYHGVVDHCALYNGKHVVSKEMLLSTFKNFDYSLLGGVNKTQFIDINKKMAYAGTMIQKDFDENWNDHGYLLWDLKGEVIHNPINNNYRHIVLKILDGKLMTPLEGLPQNLYVKWDITESGVGMEQKINQIQNDIRNDYDVKEEQYVHHSFVPETNTNISNFSFDLTVEKQQDYANEWLLSEGKILNENKKDELYKLIVYYNQKAKKKEVPCIKWKLIDLEFENILCYSEKQKIVFDNLKGLHGIIAQNNAGKSALFDVLVFSLFGKSTRTDTYSYNDLIYSLNDSEEKSLFTILNFEDVDKNLYKITRKSNNKKMNVIIEKNGIIIHDGSTREATAHITSLLGTYDDFMTISFMAQNNFHNFLLMTGKNQKEFTSRIFQLDLYDKFHKLSKNDYKKNMEKIKDLKEKVNKISEKELKETISQITNNLKENISNKLELEDDIFSNKKEKEEVLLKIKPLIKDVNKSSLTILKKLLETKKAKLNSIVLDQSEEELRSSLQKIETVDISQEKFQNNWSEILKTINLLKEARGKKVLNENKNVKKCSYDKGIKQIEKNIKLVNDFIKSDINEKEVSQKIEKLKDDLVELTNNKPSPHIYLTLEKTLDKYLIETREQLENELLNKQHSLEQLGDPGQVSNLKNIDKTEKELKEKTVLLQNIKNRLERTKKAKKRLENHKYDENCKYCCNNQFVIDAKKDMGDESKLIIEENNLINKIEEISQKILDHKQLSKKNKIIKEISELKTSIKEYNENIKLKEKIDQFESEINVKKNELHKLKKELKVAKSFDKVKNLREKLLELQKTYINLHQQVEDNDKKIDLEKKLKTILDRDKLKKEIEELKKNMVIKEENMEVERENKQIKQTILLLTDQIENNNTKILNIIKKDVELNFNLKKFDNELDELMNNNYALKQIEEKTEILNYFISMSHHNGIPSYLLKQVSNLLQTTVNSILSEYSNMKVNIKNDGKETLIRILYDESKALVKNGLNAKMLCGSEKFLVELAFRVAFQTLSNVSKPNFIICDEGWSCLDEKTRSQLDRILKTLLEYNDYILTVSHIEDVRKWMNNYIKITVDNNKRHISQ